MIKNVMSIICGFAAVLTLLFMGIIIGYTGHPYEQCKVMYVTDEDIGECVWLKENP